MKNTVPVTRGFVVCALLPSFAAAGGDPAAAFEAVGLPPPDALAPDEVIPACSYYALVDEMVRKLGDPFFPARAGEAQARQGLAVLVEEHNRSHTLGEFLLRVQIRYRKSMTHAYYTLRSDGNRVTLRIRRGINPRISTSNVDTLNAAAFVTLFRDELQDNDLAGMTVSLPDPATMPADIIGPSALIRMRDDGMILSFPADWLVEGLRARWRGKSSHLSPLPEAVGAQKNVELLRDRIRGRLGECPLRLSDIAQDFGVSERRLQRLLQAGGTNFRSLLHEERLEAARRRLRETSDPIGKIALSCGFASSQSFARSFADSFGQSPSAHRMKHPVSDQV